LQIIGKKYFLHAYQGVTALTPYIARQTMRDDDSIQSRKALNGEESLAGCSDESKEDEIEKN
jgi:hypothetical protein